MNQKNANRVIFERKLLAFAPRASAAWRKLKMAQELDGEQLADINWQRRIQLIEHCAQTIPYYQRRFKEIGFEPGDLKGEADWNRLPVLEKQDIRQHAQDLVNPIYQLADLPTATTGGTTGLPLKTYNDPKIHLASMSWRMLSWWGLHPADNSGYLYRAVPTGLSKTLRDLALTPTRRSYIAASNMTEARMDQFLSEILRSKARYLVGYVGALEVFARHCEARNVDIPNLTALWTTASPLSGNQRNYFNSVFKTASYTQYGSCEFYWIAAECRHRGGMHIGNDIRHVDVLDDGEAGNRESFGDLLITDLQNMAFPLIRYRLGDRGRLLNRTCSCGLPFPMMDYVRGRISETLELRDGTLVPGEFWTTVFDDFTDEIAAFQIIQQPDLSIHISYVPNDSDGGDAAAETVLSRLQQQTQNKAHIKMHRVEAIPHREGKVQIVIRQSGTPAATDAME